jgi:hypothetical protein
MILMYENERKKVLAGKLPASYKKIGTGVKVN